LSAVVRRLRLVNHAAHDNNQCTAAGKMDRIRMRLTKLSKLAHEARYTALASRMGGALAEIEEDLRQVRDELRSPRLATGFFADLEARARFEGLRDWTKSLKATERRELMQQIIDFLKDRNREGGA